MQYIERTISSHYWIPLLFVVAFVLLAILRQVFPKLFERWISLSNVTGWVIKKKKETVVFSGLLLIFQLLVFSVFIFLLIQKTVVEESTNPWLFVQITAGISVFLAGKWVIEKMIGYVFSIEPVIDSYLFQKNNIRGILALILFVVSVFLYFSFPSEARIWYLFLFIAIGVYVVLWFFGYKSYKSLILGNFFYFILYLCALEISPYLILYKLLV